MMEQAAVICSSVMIRGGAIRMHCGAKRYQSVRSPPAIHRSMTCLFWSKLPNSTAISRPQLRTARMAGWTSKRRNNCSFRATSVIQFPSKSTWKEASPAAQQRGWPPKVVICHSTGSPVSALMTGSSAIKAPIGNPPPNAFPSSSISGTTP